MTSPVDRFLADAVSAARDHADDGVTDGAATRLRLRESLASRGATRRKRFTLIAAVIASLFGSTAFAYWAGWRPPWGKPAAVSDAHDEAQNEGQEVSMRLPERARGADVIAIPDAGELAAITDEVVAIPDAGAQITAIPDAGIEETPAAERIVPPVVERTVPVAPRTKPRIAPAPTPAPSPRVEPTSPAPTTTPAPTSRPAPDPEIAAYRSAHQLHFRGTDAKAALAAWDAYLAQFPNGKLAPEARYDRALVLVKLARWSDARAALAPFANASAGSYRQKEAAEILAAIRDR